MTNETTTDTTAAVVPQAAHVAPAGREIGLSAAMLVQRFGSKRGLLLAAAAQGAAGIAKRFEKFARHCIPGAALLDAVEASAMTMRARL